LEKKGGTLLSDPRKRRGEKGAFVFASGERGRREGDQLLSLVGEERGGEKPKADQ